LIIGIGIDMVNVSRFAETIERTPAIVDRLFLPGESAGPDGRLRPANSLAARFAAKEAVAKALGAPAGLSWHEVEVLQADSGRPTLVLIGAVAATAAGLGIDSWHVSLSHDGGAAVAMVVAERRGLV